MAWLAEELKNPAADGTVLALHHPPVPSPLGLLALVELREQNRLAEVLKGTDVRAILGGHLHYSTSGTFAGIPVSVASATCYTQDLNVKYPAARGMNGAQSFNLVHVYPDHLLHSVVPIGEFPTVYEMSAEALEAFMALTPEEQIARVNASANAADPACWFWPKGPPKPLPLRRLSNPPVRVSHGPLISICCRRSPCW